MSTDERHHVTSLILGFMQASVISTASRIGLFEACTDPRGLSDLPEQLKIPSGACVLLVRALESLGLLEITDTKVVLSSAGKLLDPAAANSLHHLSVAVGSLYYRNWSYLEETIRTRRSATTLSLGEEFFSVVETSPELLRAIHAMMDKDTRASGPELVSKIKINDGDRVADLGGGSGLFAAMLAARHPGASVTVIESSGITAEGDHPANVRVQNKDTRIEQLGPFDRYILKSFLHDLDDRAVQAVLRQCVAEMPEHGRVIVAERLSAVAAAEAGWPEFRHELDMVVNFGVVPRGVNEYRALAAECDLRLAAATECESGYSVLEFERAEASP